MKVTLRPIHAVIAAIAVATIAYGAMRTPAPPPPPAPVPPSAATTQAKDRASAVLAVLLAPPPAPQTQPPPEGWTPEFGLKVAHTARGGLAHPPWGFRDDCSGFVSWVLSQSGVPADGHVASLFDLAVKNDALNWRTVPRPGDLVFFDDTHDRDGDADWNDELTHIGVVIDVEPDGTARFAHGGTSVGRTIGEINLAHPNDHTDANGKIINSYVREPRADDPPDATYLSGELFAAFATVDPTKDWLGAAN